MPSLNKAQKEAVEYLDGPLLIVAGAGTGKTTVISQKIVHLLTSGLGKPEEILALTFTDKAATEMQDRVDALVDVGYTSIQILTFHAFCQVILQSYGLDIGVPNKFRLLTQTDAWLLVRENFVKFNLEYYRPIGSPTAHIHELIKHFQKCKDELISPEEYLQYAEQIKLDSDEANVEEKNRVVELANAYHVYNQILLDNAALDFADLIFYTYKLLAERPNICKSLQETFKYILVDEFQDVNYSQYQLVKLLSGEQTQLTVVGDDDQSIYAFRGASVSNILSFKEDYPKTKEVVLNENYRSGQEILDISYESIKKNNPDRLEEKLKIDKKLISKVLTEKAFIEHIHELTVDDEVSAVVAKIKKLKTENADLVWDDFAILARANNHINPFMGALEKAGIPYEFLASSGLYRQPIVMDCLNFFKLVDNIYDSTAVYRLLTLPFFELAPEDLQKFITTARKKSTPYFLALKKVTEYGLSPSGIKVCHQLLSLINGAINGAHVEKPTTILYNFLEKSGYFNYLTYQEEQENQEVIRQIYQLRQFFDYVGSFEQASPGSRISDFLEHYSYISLAGDEGQLYMPTDTPDSINIMTIHGSKGLEFKYVFVVNMVEDRFPSRSRGAGIDVPLELVKEKLPEGDAHLQEERRLFYVAMTRAKKGLFFCSAVNYGGVRSKKISRFLTELGYLDRYEKKGARGDSLVGSFKDLEPAVKQHFEGIVYDLPKAFSFSQIRSYQTCPYQYKLSHILKIPLKGSASFSFGSSMHNTLQKFYERVRVLNSAKQTSLFDTPEVLPEPGGGVKVPSFDELVSLYEESWIDDWYQSKSQREEYYKKGKSILKIFYTSHENNWTIPVSLEGWFKIKVGDYLVHGRIDRVDQLADGSLEIIDYKTGKSKDKVTGSEKEQLLIYQIAAETLPQYRNIGPTSKLTFYYLNDNIKTTFIGKDKDLEKLKEKIVKTIAGIYNGDFKATPSKIVCDRCDFRDICNYRV